MGFCEQDKICCLKSGGEFKNIFNLVCFFPLADRLLVAFDLEMHSVLSVVLFYILDDSWLVLFPLNQLLQELFIACGPFFNRKLNNMQGSIFQNLVLSLD